jgi:hypothetical protein
MLEAFDLFSRAPWLMCAVTMVMLYKHVKLTFVFIVAARWRTLRK